MPASRATIASKFIKRIRGRLMSPPLGCAGVSCYGGCGRGRWGVFARCKSLLGFSLLSDEWRRCWQVFPLKNLSSSTITTRHELFGRASSFPLVCCLEVPRWSQMCASLLHRYGWLPATCVQPSKPMFRDSDFALYSKESFDIAVVAPDSINSATGKQCRA